MIGQSRDVAVIIAAYNSGRTIGRAVRSALSQDEVREVIVVDDASGDGTVEAAKAADDGSDRLTIMQQEDNRGPAAARNRAIDASRSPYIAVLDADDYLLPNRFGRVFRIPGWDLIADNVAFLSEKLADRCVGFDGFDPAPVPITFVEFVEGNISHPGRPRAELGFIKPVMSRAFLANAGLRYNESLRLGEDFALYAMMLASGARFVRCKPCGYVAIERAESLSGRHQTGDLEALLEFDDGLVKDPRLNPDERRAIERHREQLISKVHHRRVLDRRREGLVPALTAALAHPRLLPRLALSVAHDKLRRPARSKEVRYLFN